MLAERDHLRNFVLPRLRDLRMLTATFGDRGAVASGASSFFLRVDITPLPRDDHNFLNNIFVEISIAYS